MTEYDYPSPVSDLLTLGERRGQGGWPDCRALGLGPEHVPDLVRMALDEDLYWADPDSDAAWAPIHAWRALAQLRAEEAVEPLTHLLPRIDEHDDDWVGEELPRVFGHIGPVAIPVLADYLADDPHGLWARVAAAHGLEEIGTRHPEARSDAIDALTATLERFPDLDRTLNAFLISYLVDLDAVEAAPLMEHAFQADRVDLQVMGDWEDVQIELGLLDGRESPSPNAVLGDLSGLWDEVREKEARRRLREIGRNDACWCGSGKKYKHCHLRDDEQQARA
ncbi:MAG: SEC-C metal-binding domain-containing protein [Chloroflexota bacterium]|nr:SEC-C metal-binding domain-containing protein [Chloroflexota bacterium]